VSHSALAGANPGPEACPAVVDRADVLIVGAGLAGLFLALRLAPRPCLVLSPAPLGEAASSAWAQGGLAAALAPDDSPELHAADTVAAGAGLVDPAVALLIAREGPARVRDLLTLGVPFDRSPEGALSLSLEAAHSRPRVARVAGDLAGRAIMGALVEAVRAQPSIRVVEGVRAIALARAPGGNVAGVVALRAGVAQTFAAAETVLCAGGTGGLYRVTTNPRQALGEGLAMAWQAGALIADPEFVQFHPTAIDVGRDPAPLATEALRGEGAVLVGRDGARFMGRYSPLADLAPRDIVARGVASELAAGRGAFLDTRAAVGAHFPDHFPTVFAACMAAGIDPRDALIPVAPAAHYHMGGIVTDVWGRTTLPGLSACGECASTGAHGANRLASNSLLEAVVFSARIADRLREGAAVALPEPESAVRPAELPAQELASLRAGMAQACGVVRTGAALAGLSGDIDSQLLRHPGALPVVCARLMVRAALARTESRGGHFREDFPELQEPAQRTFLHADTLTLEPVS